MKFPKIPNMRGETIFNSGTSEGVQKSWETRRAKYSKQVKISGIIDHDGDDDESTRVMPSEKTDGKYDVWHHKNGAKNMVSDPENPMDISGAQDFAVKHAMGEIGAHQSSAGAAAPDAQKKPQGMSLEEARAHLAEQSKHGVFGYSWDKIREMQGGGLPKPKLGNRSTWPTIFLPNKAMPESLAKATAVRKGAAALDELKDGAPPIGFTGSVHPLTDVAEHATAAAVNNDDPKSHNKAAEAHDEAAAKMASFMKEVSPKKHTDHAVKMKGLTATREHHISRAAAHRNRAAFLEHQDDKAKAEAKAAKKKK